jgi:hypothetical protein
VVRPTCSQDSVVPIKSYGLPYTAAPNSCSSPGKSFIKPAPPVSDRAKSFSFSYIFVIPSTFIFLYIIFHQTLIEAMKTQKRMRKSPHRRRSRKVDPSSCFCCWLKKRSVSNYLGKIAFAKYHHLQTKIAYLC